MNAIVQFVMRNGYSVLFAVVFARQLGVPLPAPMFLVVVGTLVAAGKLCLIPTLILAVTGCILADWVWYEAGRQRGDKVLHFIHRLTRDPEAHDRRTKASFARYGHRLLVVAKFVPGLDAITPPLAGTSGTSRLRFLALDAAGASLYSCVYGGLGYVFSHDLNHAVAYAGRVGTILAGVAFAALSIYEVRKLVLRHRSRRESGLARITATVPMRCAGAAVDSCTGGLNSTLSPVSPLTAQSSAEKSYGYGSAPLARLLPLSQVRGETQC